MKLLRCRLTTLGVLLPWLFIAFTFSACHKKIGDDLPGTQPGDLTKPPAQMDVPAGIPDGVSFTADQKWAFFNLYVPGKHSVYLIGDFNHWKADSSSRMINSKDGSRWWIKLDGIAAKVAYGYQFLVDDTLRIADPYATLILDPANDKFISDQTYPHMPNYPTAQTTGIVGVFSAGTADYQWQVKDFKRPDKNKLVVYELLVRDFIDRHDYSTLKDTLDYMERLGVNAIELLPVNEFEGNDSWGYNSNFMFALDKYYGTKDAYKAFVDACHQKGIAVIQDIVLEDQFGSSPMVRLYASSTGAPSADNPWLDPENRHPYAVGYQMNHESAATKYYVKNVLSYWIKEFHIDGYRFDQAKGFTQKTSVDDSQWSAYDASRVAILTDYSNYLNTLGDDLYLILEYFADPREQAQLAAKGAIIWENLSFNAEQAAMGYNDDGGRWDLSGLSYSYNQYLKPAGQISYFESHDEERLQFKNGAYGNKDSTGSYNIQELTTGLKRDEMMAVFLFCAPGPKMLWEFGERGYDVSIGQDMERLARKPPHWEYMQDQDRKRLYDLYCKMIHLKINNEVFNTGDIRFSLEGAVKSMLLKGADGTDVLVVGNFDVYAKEVVLPFPHIGKWNNVLENTAWEVTSLTQKINLAPGSYLIFSDKILHP